MQTQTLSPIANFPSAITAFLCDLINYLWCLRSTSPCGEGLGEVRVRMMKVNIGQSEQVVLKGGNTREYKMG